MIEILAPAGGKEQLIAAVRCKADAVYFGMSAFNARRNADNFADEELAETIKYCHDREVKVYITLNTLLMDSELNDAYKAADRAEAAGADGIIVQDLAMAACVKKLAAKRSSGGRLKLIASTQMAVHNVSGALLLKEYGFDRIVLARELSLSEIKSIAATGIETEVFVHGAHCMSVSGNCYLSALIGERSGNRGLCAQPCRLPWSCKGCSEDHCLSLKDLSFVKHVNELQEAGVTSLKIEGRMKRAEYVAAAVTAVRKALLGGEPDMESLRAVFSRSGFTDGYITGKRSKDMFGYRTREDVLAARDVLKDLKELYKNESYSKPVDMVFTAKMGEPASLEIILGEKRALVYGPVPEAAISRPMDYEYIKRSLSKTGGTLYSLSGLECNIEDGLMLPLSALNKMRREALDALSL